MSRLTRADQKPLSFAPSTRCSFSPGRAGSICRSNAAVLTAFCSSPVSFPRLSVKVSAMRNSMPYTAKQKSCSSKRDTFAPRNTLAWVLPTSVVTPSSMSQHVTFQATAERPHQPFSQLRLHQPPPTDSENHPRAFRQQRCQALHRLLDERPVDVLVVVPVVAPTPGHPRLAAEKPQAQPLVLAVVRGVEVRRRRDHVRHAARERRERTGH